MRVKIARTTLGVVLGLAGVSAIGITLHIRRRRRSELHTYGSMLRQYFEYFILSILGTRMRKKLETDSANFVEVQEETLLKILKSNAGSEYGIQYKFGDIQDKKQYVTLHPLTRYNHYKDYVGEILYASVNLAAAPPPPPNPLPNTSLLCTLGARY